MRWSDEDEYELKKWYDKCGSEIPSLLEKGFTKNSIRRKAQRMGVTRGRDLDREKLWNMYHNKYMTVKQIARETGKSVQTIYKKLHQFDIPITGDKRLKECEKCGKLVEYEKDDEVVVCSNCSI